MAPFGWTYPNAPLFQNLYTNINACVLSVFWNNLHLCCSHLLEKSGKPMGYILKDARKGFATITTRL